MSFKQLRSRLKYFYNDISWHNNRDVKIPLIASSKKVKDAMHRFKKCASDTSCIAMHRF